MYVDRAVECPISSNCAGVAVAPAMYISGQKRKGLVRSRGRGSMGMQQCVHP